MVLYTSGERNFKKDVFKVVIKNEDTAVIFKALSDPRRIRILKLLQDGEQCACTLIEKLKMPQSTLSYHMKLPVKNRGQQGSGQVDLLQNLSYRQQTRNEHSAEDYSTENK